MPLVGTDASLNSEKVRDARGDLAFVNSRFLLNVDGRIGGRASNDADSQRLEILNWGKNVSNELQDLASRTSKQHVTVDKVNNNDDKTRNRTNRNQNQIRSSINTNRSTKDGLQIQVSAHVRFYLVNYLRKRAEISP